MPCSQGLEAPSILVLAAGVRALQALLATSAGKSEKGPVVTRGLVLGRLGDAAVD